MLKDLSTIQRKRTRSQTKNKNASYQSSSAFSKSSPSSLVNLKCRMPFILGIPLLMFILTYYISYRIIPSQMLYPQQEQEEQEQEQEQLTNIGDYLINSNYNRYLDYDMVILYYSSIFGMSPSSSYLRNDIPRDYYCNITDKLTSQILYNQKILLTDSHNFDLYSIGFVFHGPDTYGNNIRNKNNINDIYIYHNMESPAITSISLTDISTMKYFSLLMSYQFSSDIFLPYVGRGTIKQLIDTPILYSFSEKDLIGADLAWVGSNCGAYNGRQDYLRELFKYIPTHSYGSCLKTSGKSYPHGQSLKHLVSKYKFYIVIENSNCADYITEKLGAAIISSSVPIVFSVNNIPNYNYYLPPNSFINIADFNSAKELAKYLIKIGSNETLYNQYLYYKYNAIKSNKFKEIEWENILKRFQYKETANHWCRAANSIWNYHRNFQINNITSHVPVDDSCLEQSIMTKYIDRNKNK